MVIDIAEITPKVLFFCNSSIIRMSKHYRLHDDSFLGYHKCTASYNMILSKCYQSYSQCWNTFYMRTSNHVSFRIVCCGPHWTKRSIKYHISVVRHINCTLACVVTYMVARRITTITGYYVAFRSIRSLITTSIQSRVKHASVGSHAAGKVVYITAKNYWLFVRGILGLSKYSSAKGQHRHFSFSYF